MTAPRLAQTPRRLSTSARLALANAAVLAGGFGVLLFLVTLLADRFMAGHVRESVEAELRILESEFRSEGPAAVRMLIEERMRMVSPDHDRLYRLEDADGRMIAGNVAYWPTDHPSPNRPFKLASRRFKGQTDVDLQWVVLPQGYRLLVGFDEIEIAQVRHDINRAALWGLLAMMLASLTAGYGITRAALRPVEAIRNAAQQIVDGDLRHRIPVRPDGDEFDRLGETLNAMLDRINALITSVRGATDSIAHDLRTPLARHRAQLEAALSAPPSAEALPSWIERNIADLDVVLSTFQSLLRISTVQSGLLRREFQACELPQLIQDAIDYIEPLAEDKQQQIRFRSLAGPPLHGHRDLLFQLLVNLLDNAVKYTPAGGEIVVAAAGDAAGWELSVADSGPGIPEAERERVFERLYRVDASRQQPGLGLGLSLVKAVIDLHRGSVVILDNAPGTRVLIRFRPGVWTPLPAQPEAGAG